MATTLIRYQQRRNTAAQWTASNEVLLAGEPGYETDTGKSKLGNGTTTWTGLPYQPDPASTPTKTLLDVVYPEDYYLPADGTDWRPAFLRAQAAGRWIRLRSNTNYTISSAIRNVSNRRWSGGPGTKIVVSRTATNTVTRCAFMLGNIHPAMFNYASQGTSAYLPAHDVAPVAAGDITVTLTSTGNAAAYTVGQFVAVRHVTETTASGVTYPLWAQFTKVTAITGTAITLADPVMEALPTACVSPIGTTIDTFMGYPWEIIEDVTIEDIDVDGLSIVSTRTGAYNCTIRNSELFNGTRVLAVNAFTKCVAENLSGDNLADRVLEVKCYSQDNDFINIRGRITIATTANYPVDIGEQSNRNRVRNIKATVPTGNATVQPTVAITGQLNTFTDPQIITVGTGTPAAISMPSTSFGGYGPRGNKILGGRSVVSAPHSHHVIIGSTGATDQPIHYVIDGFETVGATASGFAVRIAAGGAGGSISKSSLVGVQTEIITGASAPAEANNSYSDTSGSSMLGGSSSPSSFSAEAGTIYQRRNLTDRMPAYVKLGTGAFQSWVRLLTLGGYRTVTDNDLTVGSGAVEVNDYTLPMVSTRAFTLPAVSGVDIGWRYVVTKRTNTGAGNLNINFPAGTTIATIPAATKARAECVWTGTTWAVDVIPIV